MKKVEIIEVFLAQRGLCFYCFKPMSWLPGSHATSYTKDHFHAKSRGNSLNGNLVLAHKQCNLNKGNREPTKREQQRFKQLYRKIAERQKVLNRMMGRNRINNVEKYDGSMGRW